MEVYGQLLLEIENIQGEELKMFEVSLKWSKDQVSLKGRLSGFFLAPHTHLSVPPDAGVMTR